MRLVPGAVAAIRHRQCFLGAAGTVQRDLGANQGRVMKITCLAFALAAAAALHSPLYAAVTLTSLTPSLSSPQPLGTSVRWVVTGTDSNPNPLTFQFNVTSPTGAVSTKRRVSCADAYSAELRTNETASHRRSQLARSSSSRWRPDLVKL